MNFTAKSRYAIKIMIDLALDHDKTIHQREDIARRAGVPSDFMDQITVRLKNAGLLESIRGRKGGYRLSRSPESISAYDIFVAVEGANIQPVACIDSSDICDHDTFCQSKGAWEMIYGSVKGVLESHTLESLTRDLSPKDFVGLESEKRECLAPRKEHHRIPSKKQPSIELSL